MKLRHCCLSALLAMSATLLPAQSPHGTVRTDTVWSQALGIRKKLVVYLPPSYDTDAGRTRRYPMAVYLHGAWGSEVDWTVHGNLAATMDSLVATGMPEMIVVMPDGDDGWWSTWHSLNDYPACRRVSRKESADTYCVPWPKYDDYVTYDVITHADRTYRTIARRESRAIAGLSMGGYGAITIAARSPRVFAVAASHSGVLHPALMADSSGLASGGSVVWRDARTAAERKATSGAARWAIITPAFGTDSISWASRDPAEMIARLVRRHDPMPLWFVDVGTGDHLLPQNRAFRDALADAGVPLVYAEWGGVHDWVYWSAHLPESLKFIAGHLAH